MEGIAPCPMARMERLPIHHDDQRQIIGMFNQIGEAEDTTAFFRP